MIEGVENEWVYSLFMYVLLFANSNGLSYFEASLKQDSHLWYWELISSISYVSHLKTLFIIKTPYTRFILTTLELYPLSSLLSPL